MTTDQDAVSRRNMLIGLGSVAVAGVAVAATAPTQLTATAPGSAPSVWSREYWTLEGAGVEEWTRMLQSDFYVVDDDARRVKVRLIKVVPANYAGTRPAELGRSSGFVAVFDPLQKKLRVGGDRIYTMSQTNYGNMQFFLGQANARGRFEAVFN